MLQKRTHQKNQTSKKKGNIEGFAKKMTSTKTRKIESGTSFEVKTHVTPFSTKKININNNLFKNKKKRKGGNRIFCKKIMTTTLTRQLT